MPGITSNCETRITKALLELGLPISLLTNYHLPSYEECQDLVAIGPDMFGREQQMDRTAAAQWSALRIAAKRAGVILSIVSAFRSLDHQKQIIARKLASGQSIEEILRVSALPGFSEHHTGRAVDIGTPGNPPLTEAFEKTSAFAWLNQHAHEFHFHLSYPRNNTLGVIYEPWHWFFQKPHP